MQGKNLENACFYLLVKGRKTQEEVQKNIYMVDQVCACVSLDLHAWQNGSFYIKLIKKENSRKHNSGTCMHVQPIHSHNSLAVELVWLQALMSMCVHIAIYFLLCDNLLQGGMLNLQFLVPCCTRTCIPTFRIVVCLQLSML